MKEIKLGDLTPTRDFNFVKDTANGFLAIAESSDTVGKEINIATNQEASMGEILKKITEIMHSDITCITEEQRLRPALSEVFRLWGDNTLITSLTNWKPQYSLVQGLEETIQWYLREENLKKFKAGIYNV